MADRTNNLTGEKIGRIDATLEALNENVQGIQVEIRTMNETLAVNTKQLEIHIEGVRLAREQNEILREDMNLKLQPLQDHVVQVKTIWKLLAIVAGVPALTYYSIMAFAKIKELSGH